MPENTLSFLENFFSPHPATNQLLYWRQPSQLLGVLTRWFLSSAVTSWPWLVVSPWMGLFWAVARCSSLEELRARLGLVPVRGKSLAPRVLRVRFLWNATSVLGMSGGMRLASLQLVRDLRSYTWWSFALWPCSLGQVEGLAHQNFIFDKVILCNCGGDVLWLMALMSCVAVGWPS